MSNTTIAVTSSRDPAAARRRRRLLVEMMQRRVRPGTGSGERFILRRTAVNAWPDLQPILTDIPWVIVGGVATRAYMPERMTQDLDILIKAADEEVALARLKGAGYSVQSSLAIAGYQLRSPGGVEVDLLLGEAPWLEEALQKPERDPAGYPVLSLPYLVLLKLEASRAQDIADVSRMLGWASDETLHEVRRIVRMYRPEDEEDLESLIFIGRQERRQSD
jgi:hypothetical protein